jgi:hypothetical protein
MGKKREPLKATLDFGWKKGAHPGSMGANTNFVASTCEHVGANFMRIPDYVKSPNSDKCSANAGQLSLEAA